MFSNVNWRFMPIEMTFRAKTDIICAEGNDVSTLRNALCSFVCLQLRTPDFNRLRLNDISDGWLWRNVPANNLVAHY